MGALRRRLVVGGRERDGIVGERLLTYSGAGYLGQASTIGWKWSSWAPSVRSPSITIRTLIVRDELVELLDAGTISRRAKCDPKQWWMPPPKEACPRRRA